jgi:hypothetical protein
LSEDASLSGSLANQGKSIRYWTFVGLEWAKPHVCKIEQTVSGAAYEDDS